MTQLSLPRSNPQDRGRLNALRNIVSAVSDELRQQAPIATGIVNFTTNDLPQILRQYTPFDILSASSSSPEKLSPYPFQIFDFVTTTPRTAQTEVFPTVSDLIKSLDVQALASPLQQAELIGVDESKVDTPFPHGSLAFLKSVAFRMFTLPDGSSDESVGPIVSKVRMQLRDEEGFELENQLLGYIRNHFIAYISALSSLAFGRTPFIVLHGPLIRAIGSFSKITFSYEMARELLNIDLGEAGEYELPANHSTPVINGDNHTKYNMSFIPRDAINGEKNLHRFNEFCIKQCERRCVSCKVYNQKAEPPDRSNVNAKMVSQRDYPGFCLYFWMLRSLNDLARLSKATVASVVETTSLATEMTRFVLPSLLALPQAHRAAEQSDLAKVLKALNMVNLKPYTQRRDLYNQTNQMIETLRLSDSNIFSYVLAEGQYTAPTQIYRYRTRNTFDRALGYSSLGTLNEFENILDALFPHQEKQGHPGYRALMSYLRTTPLREPVRVEYFHHPHQSDPAQIIGPIYLLSLPYQEYGMPVILYYADKLARTPTKLVQTIIEREYLDLVLENRLNDPVSIQKILGHLTRGYFQREGLK